MLKNVGRACLAIAGVCMVGVSPALAQSTMSISNVPLTLGWSGFIRADYGDGSRYPVADGEDVLGISKSFLVLTANTEDIQAVLDFGASVLTDANVNPNDNGQVGVKDAFIVIGAGKATGFSFSAGAQPLLFGLKPNGYPGDSSLVPNIDYGVDGAFAVSQQAGPSLIGDYKFTPDESLHFGAFDLAQSNAISGFTLATNGSKLKDNLFLLWRGNHLLNTGAYATAGAERTYVGSAGGEVVDRDRPIFSAGVGFKQGPVDVSVEYIHLDSAIVNTATGERYIRAAASVQPADQWIVYADYSNGHELGASTYRIGASWQFRTHLAFTVEYAKDDFSSNGIYTGTGAVYGTVPSPNIQSGNVRLTFTF